MSENDNKYLPRFGDIVYIDWGGGVGYEIIKRRPAIVMSHDAFNESTGFVAVCPITSTSREREHFVKLEPNHIIKGAINPFQLKTFDYTSKERNIQFMEHASDQEIFKTYQRMSLIFGSIKD